MFCKRCGKECEPGDLSVTGLCMECCEEITRAQQAQFDAMRNDPPPRAKSYPEPKLNIKLVRKKGVKPVPPGLRRRSVHVPNRMGKAIVALLFGSIVFGILAIVFAGNANDYLARNDYSNAARMATKSDLFASIAIIIGVVRFLFVALLFCMAMAAAG